MHVPLLAVAFRGAVERYADAGPPLQDRPAYKVVRLNVRVICGDYTDARTSFALGLRTMQDRTHLELYAVQSDGASRTIVQFVEDGRGLSMGRETMPLSVSAALVLAWLTRHVAYCMLGEGAA